METILIYLLKSSALLAAFFLAYHLLLRKETFFKSNRWYLLFGLVTSLILPLVTFKKVILIEPVKQTLDWNLLAQSLPQNTVSEPQTLVIDWFLVLLSVYGIGLAVFLLRFLFDFYSLAKMLKGKTVMKQEDYKFLDVAENVSPFSYFNYIVYNSSFFSQNELDNILEHEKVHSDQNHTIDVLIVRIFCIAFWYNPFVWLYKKAILQNLEFIADYEASKKIADIKAYQRTLLKITTHDYCVSITNHFFQSLIKKRIVMLNKSQSKKWNSWKYSLVIPALIAFMFYFQVKVVAQEKPSENVTVIPTNGVETVINKNSSDKDLKSESERIKKESGVNLKISKVKRNKEGQIIAIKAEFKDKNGKSGTTQVSGNEPIKPIRFYKNGDIVGFGKAKQDYVTYYKGNGAKKSDSESSFSFSFSNDGPEAPEPPEAPDAPETPNNFVKIKKVSKNGNPVIVIDGEVIDTDAILSEVLSPDMIKSVRVSRNGDSDGTIYIDTKKITEDAMKLAREAIATAKIQIENAKPEIERAKKEIELSKPEMEIAKEEIKKAKEEMIKAKAEMEQAKVELQKAKAEIEKAKSEAKKEKK